jgi:hypothetical protein
LYAVPATFCTCDGLVCQEHLGGQREVPDAQDEAAGDGEAPRAEPGMDVDLTGAIHQELPPGDDGGTVPWWLAQRR